MLRGNLSTRPFYNERLVSLVLLLVAAGVAALSIYNVRQFMALSAKRQELNARITRDRAEAEAIVAATARMRQSVDLVSLRRLAADTVEANGLIDHRTFSWTAFFSVIQSAIPLDVRLQAVAPTVEKGVVRIRMVVVAKTEVELYRFVDALRRTGKFPDAYATNQQLQDDGTTWVADVQAEYTPPTPLPAPKPAAGRGRGNQP